MDQRTYEKYQSLPDQRIADKPLGRLVEINSANSSKGDYARLRLEGGRCPALLENLCAIQQTLGESYIPDLCSKYPRVLQSIGGAVERSLHLSCPEAARLALEDPDAMVLEERTEETLAHREGSVNRIEGAEDDLAHPVRALAIELIRERSLPLWQRVVCVGFAINRIAGVDMAGAVAILEEHLKSVRRGSFGEILNATKGNRVFQLDTVLELVVRRLGSDYTSPRFLECYKDFMNGLAWTPKCTIEELAARHEFAALRYFQPFVERNEHLLENYLINYLFIAAFPYRTKLPGGKFVMDTSSEAMRRSFVILAVHYAIIRTLLIGMAALHKSEFSVQHAVRLVQSYSKAFLHCVSFEAAAMEYLNENVGDPVCKVAEMVMD